MSFLRASTLYVISMGVIAAACSAESPARSDEGGIRSTGSGGASAGTTGGAPTTGSGGTGGPIIGAGGRTGTIDPGNPDAGSGGGGLTVDAACLAEPVRGEKKQVDLYLMMDSSGSMMNVDPGQTASRWDLLRAALPIFLSDPANAGMMVGLDFFPEAGPGPGGNTNANPSCSVADYSMPNVPIAMLPGPNNAQIDAVTAAVNARMVQGSTPTTPALTGALTVARDWQMAHPGRSLNVVLLSDGEPTMCMPNTIETASNLAGMFATATPPIKTYVLGIGPFLNNLNQIAQGGGTGMAYLVDMGGAAALVAALAAIRQSTLSCDYKIPTWDGGLDLKKINVSTRVGPTGMHTEILQVADAISCGTGAGWFFDNAASPTKITLCPGTCTPLQVTDGSELQVLIGCPTRIRPPPK
jgi:hypothetical protein